MTGSGLQRRPWHETVTVRGLQHRLTWWGERSATPVILLHGWMDTGETWQFLVDHLPESWSCVAPDWRGFGGTEWPADGYWFADYLADLEAMLDQLSPGEPARLIAHSMGGNVASMYAGIRPKRARWLVNVEGVGLKRSSPDGAPDHYAEWLDGLREPVQARRYGSIESVINFIVSRNPAMTRERGTFLAQAWTRPSGRRGDDGLRSAPSPRRCDAVSTRRSGSLLAAHRSARAAVSGRRFGDPAADQSGWERRVLPFAVPRPAHRPCTGSGTHDASRSAGTSGEPHCGVRGYALTKLALAHGLLRTDMWNFNRQPRLERSLYS